MIFYIWELVLKNVPFVQKIKTFTSSILISKGMLQRKPLEFVVHKQLVV